MASDNFFLDNDDLRFQMEKRVDWDTVLDAREDLSSDECPYDDKDEAVETFLDMLSDPIGTLAAERIAPRAEEVDVQGCRLEEGRVILPEGMRKNMEDLTEADLMGLSLPRRYEGLGFPTTVYTAATEIISRADVSLMNLFGLQGIAETIARFADDEIKEKYIPRFSRGEVTGAMVLTEADAGSDLMAIQARALEGDGENAWRIRGSKRFITNGCGEVLLVLARSEDPAKYSGARGLSLFLVEADESVQIRRIEEKMGIHGSPTCEMYFDDSPAVLIGRKGRGLTQYVNWLMNAARLGVAAQSLGIMEAAYRESLRYAREREQFGKAILHFPPVAEMLVEIKATLEAVRSLVYRTAEAVDVSEGYTVKLDGMDKKDPAYAPMKQKRDAYAKKAELLTPIVKYYASEASIRVANLGLQVHGGSGYMKDYAIERLYRDARITNIYEGTSQMQIDRAMGKIVKGSMAELFDETPKKNYDNPALQRLSEMLDDSKTLFGESLDTVLSAKTLRADAGEEGDNASFRALMARRIVDMGSDVYMGLLLLEEASVSERKVPVAEHFIRESVSRARMHAFAIQEGSTVPIGFSTEAVFGE